MRTGLPLPPRTANGRIINLEAHGYTASIASVGATVVSLKFAGRALVREFDPQQVRPVFSGTILAPWPNRVLDGLYSFDGVEHQLPINEPGRGHALHGLVFWNDFQILEHDESSVQLQSLVPPREGYPFALDLRLSYELKADGLHTTAKVQNLGVSDAPFGWGSHCYLVAPGASVDDWILSLQADDVQLVSGERLIPQGVHPVTTGDGALDFRNARPVGQVLLDHAYTGLSKSSAEPYPYRVTLTDSTGLGAQISWDESCPWVQLHTAEQADPALHRTALAVEPMSCPPGAFNDGTDLMRLAPGSRAQASWVIGEVSPTPHTSALEKK